MNFKTHNNSKQKLITSLLLIFLLFVPIVSIISSNFIATLTNRDSVNSEKDLFHDTPISTSQGTGEDLWWNYSWQYRIPIDLAASNEDLADYQLKLTLELTEWYNNGYLNETGKDIRFADGSGQGLNFWIENLTVTGGNSTIWVKVPELTTAGTRIYMYIGNPDAESKSDGSEVFDLFDDFEGTSLDSKWYDSDTSSRSHDVSNGILSVMSGGIGLQNPLDFKIQNGYIVETKCLFNESSSWYSGTVPEISSSQFTTGGNGAGDATILYMKASGGDNMQYWVGDGSTTSYNLGYGDTGWTANNDEWYLTGVSVIGGDSDSTAKLWRDGVNITTFSGITWRKDINYTSLGSFNGGTSDVQDTRYDWIRIRKYTTYDPTVSIGNVEFAQLNITCLDIDGQRVEGAQVYITNDTEPFLNQSGTTDENGEVVFRDIPTGYYNLTVNYTLNDDLSPKTETVYYSENYHKVEHELELHLNLWTIDFEVEDTNGEPLDYGYINISAEGNRDVISKMELDDNGEAKFIWNASKNYYNYSVYYYNPDYTTPSTPLYSGEVYREETYREYNVNETAEAGSIPENIYYVEENNIYLYDDVGYSGPDKIVEIRVQCWEMDDNLSLINVKYSDVNHETSYTDEKSADVSYKPLDNGTIIYGIQKLRVEFKNTSQSDGRIQLNLTHTYEEKITVNMSKLSLRVLDYSHEEGVAGLDLIVRYNESGEKITTLETDSEGYAYGEFTNDFSFWYLNDTTYNFTLEFQGEEKDFDVVNSSQFKPQHTRSYNYTLNALDNLVFALDFINISERQSNFTDGDGPGSVIWGENMSFWVLYESSNNSGDTWNPDYMKAYDTGSPKYTSARIEILDRDENLLFESSLTNASVLSSNDGNFTITINSSRFSAGGDGEFYYAYIYGQKDLWGSPSRAYFGFNIEPISTEIELYNYSSLNPLSEKYSQYYMESINVSFSYSTNAQQILEAETISYNWDEGDGSLTSGSIKVHPDNSDYYYFTVDTSKVNLIGEYLFSISATRENYSTNTKYFNLKIERRPTIINDTIAASYTRELDIFEARNFTLEYNDTLISERIGSCETKYYHWFKLDDEGNRIGTAGTFGTYVENITETTNKLYTIDFNTEQKSLGTYEMIVHLQKNNYEQQQVFFSITIEKRTFSSPDLTDLDTKTRTVQQGNSVNIQINLTDSSAGREGQPLTDALVTIEGGGRSIELTETTDGIYEGSISTSQYNTFFQGKTISYTLNVSKDNYQSQEITFNVNVEMMSVAGIPIFYLILGISFAAGIIGALGIYRYVQIARIPEFVKRSKAIKKEIKKGKPISDKYLYQNKKEYLVERFSDDWDVLDLSIEDALGLRKGSKKKPGEETMKGGAK